MSTAVSALPAAAQGVVVDVADLALLGLRPMRRDGWMVVLGGVHSDRSGLSCTVTAWPCSGDEAGVSMLLREGGALQLGSASFVLVEMTVAAVRCTAGATGELARFVPAAAATS